MAEVKSVKLQNNNHISGALLRDGIDQIGEDINISGGCVSLALLDSEGYILATSASLKYDAEGIKFTPTPGSDNGGTLKINTIKAQDTIPWKEYVSTNGKKANFFALALWNSSNIHSTQSDIEGSVSETYPKENTRPEKIYLVGTLTNTPLITQDTNFQFNASTVTFVIG